MSTDGNVPKLNITPKDLEEQLKSLQKAVAQIRGENNEFREEVLFLLRRWHSWSGNGRVREN